MSISKYFQFPMHPYRRVRTLYILGLVALMGSLWLVSMGAYHILYVALNLLEVLPLSVERVWLMGYGVWGILTLGGSWFFLRPREGFSRFLEREFHLGFRWFNAVDAADGDMDAVPRTEAAAILERVHVLRALWEESRVALLAGPILWGVLFLAHGLATEQTDRFFSNTQAVWRSAQYTYTLTYDERINEGSDWGLSYSGDYETAVFSIQGVELLQLRSGETGKLTERERSFSGDLYLTHGRIRHHERLVVTVTPPPALESVELRLTHIPTGQNLEVSGIKRILIDQPSRVVARLGYRASDVLSEASVVAETNLEGLNGEAQTNLASRNIPAQIGEGENTVRFTTVIRESSRFRVLATNATGQVSEAHEIDFIVRENRPPTLTIESPPPRLSIFELAEIPVQITAQDDIALETLELELEARSREGEILWTRTLTHAKEAIAGKTLVSVVMRLPLLGERSSTGTQFYYHARVTDYAGLTNETPQQVVAYLPKSDFFKQNLSEGEVLEQGIERGDESVSNLAKEFERLEILSEKKNVELKDLRRFEENAAELSEQLRQEEQALEDLQESLSEQKSLSPALEQKLSRLRESLQEIDKNFLENLTRSSENILEQFSSNVSPEELRQEIQKLDVEELERRIEQTLELVNNVRAFQKLFQLKELADNLYERFRDLEGYLVYEDLSDQDIQNEGDELRRELDYIAKEWETIVEGLPKDPRTERLRDRVSAELEAKKRATFDQLARNRDRPEFISERSTQLSRLRQGLTQLAQQVTAEEWAAALTELNYQIFTLSEKNFATLNIFSGEEYVLRTLREPFLRELLSETSSDEKDLLRRFKDQLEEVGSSFWDIAVFDIYGRGIDEMERVQRAIDPASQIRQEQTVKAEEAFTNILVYNNELVTLLLELKEQLQKEQEQQQQQNTLANAAESQSSLNNRLENWLRQQQQQQQQGGQQQQQQGGQQQQQGGQQQQNQPSPQEEAYLRSLLAEQQYIRELIEQMLQGQQGQPGQQGEGQEGQGQEGQGQQGEGQDGQGQQGQGEGQEGQGQNGQGQQGQGQQGQGQGEGQQGQGQGQDGQGQQGQGSQQGQGQGNGQDGQNGQRQGGQGQGDRQGRAQGSQGQRGSLGNDGEGLLQQNSLQQLAERIRELEEELIKRNPDLARVRALKDLIENNLLRHSEGLEQEQEDGEPEDEERRAEQDFEDYGPRVIERYDEENLYRLEERLNELNTRNVYPEEYRAKIEVFLRALKQTFPDRSSATP